MSTSNDQHIKVLNGLIETTLDSAQGYKDAAADTKNPRFKTLFELRSVGRRQLTAALKSEVRDLGGVPEEDGSVLGSAHRVFVNLKNIVSSSDQAIVDEVEAGEDHIKGKFQDVLRNAHLPNPAQEAVIKAYAEIKADHDQMRDLKHELQRHTPT